MKKGFFTNRYLIINGENISHCTYELVREASCNDFWNVPHVTGKETASKVFKQCNIDKNHNKIVFKVKDFLVSNTLYLEEVITGTKFIGYYNKETEYIKAHTESNLICDYATVISKKDYVDKDAVKSFYQSMSQEELDSYIETVHAFLRTEEENRKVDKFLPQSYQKKKDYK